mgnify:CR=1 FL=1
MSAIPWIPAVLVRGHGVASGRSTTSPYPGGTIALQLPFFADLGLDLLHCWPGTLNLSVAPLELRLRDPDHRFPLVHWTDHHPPETFSFWRIEPVLAVGVMIIAACPGDVISNLVTYLI